MKKDKLNKTFSLEELCALVDMNKRTIRYYIQKDLVDRPLGKGKGASYNHQHIEQLLTIRKWKDAGVSLDRIHDLLRNEGDSSTSGQAIPPRPRQRGSIEVWSHLYIDEGVEIHLDPQRSGLTSEQVRALCKAVIEQYEKIKSEEN